MRIRSHAGLKLWGAFLLSACLVSCSSTPDAQPSETAASTPDSISTPMPSPSSPSVNISGEPTREPSDKAMDEPKSTQSLPDNQPAESAPTVEVSTVKPKPTETVPEVSEQPVKSPLISLSGLKLGTSEKDAVKHLGLPTETYPLPGDKLTIEIWEYDGFSVGMNEAGKIVYIEVLSSDVKLGVEGLQLGMDGTEAAQILGIASDKQTNVLTVQVSGGWLKLDLDPDNQQVLSLKLLSEEI